MSKCKSVYYDPDTDKTYTCQFEKNHANKHGFTIDWVNEDE